jgi:hypothetical protein
VLQHYARLLLPHALARVLREGDGGRLARIRLPLRAREPERIERIGLLEDVDHGVQARGCR